MPIQVELDRYHRLFGPPRTQCLGCASLCSTAYCEACAPPSVTHRGNPDRATGSKFWNGHLLGHSWSSSSDPSVKHGTHVDP